MFGEIARMIGPVGYARRTLGRASWTRWRQEQRQDVRDDAGRTWVRRWCRTWSRSGPWGGHTGSARTSRTTGWRMIRASGAPWSATWRTTRATWWPLRQQDTRIGSASKVERMRRARLDRNDVLDSRDGLDSPWGSRHGGLAPRGGHHHGQCWDQSVHESHPPGMTMSGTIARPCPGSILLPMPVQIILASPMGAWSGCYDSVPRYPIEP